MRYTFKTRGNRKLYAGYAASAVLLGSTLLPPLLFPGRISLGIALVAGFLAYHIIRFLIRHIRSNILTHDDGVTFFFPSGSIERLSWEEITHSGRIMSSEGKPVLFIYAEKKDRLATVPDEYENLGRLQDELKERCPWYELEQQEGISLEKTILPLVEHKDS